MTKHKSKKKTSALSRSNDARRKREEYARKKAAAIMSPFQRKQAAAAALETPDTAPPKGNVTPPNEVQLALKGMGTPVKRKKPSTTPEIRKLIKTCVAYVSLNGVNAVDLHHRSGMSINTCYNIVGKKPMCFLGAKTVLKMQAYMGRPEVAEFMLETKAKPKQVLVHATNRPEDGAGTGYGLKSPIPPRRHEHPKFADMVSPRTRQEIAALTSTKNTLGVDAVNDLVSAFKRKVEHAERLQASNEELRKINAALHHTAKRLESEVEEKDAQRQDDLAHKGGSHHMTHVCKENVRLRAALHILTAP